MATYLDYPFDPELFSYNWRMTPDTTTEAMFQSGAVAQDAEIAKLIAGGSDFYTVPYYGGLSGDPVNYDGATDITSTEPDGTSASGIVFGRAKGFTARDFVFDYNSGADPMTQIISQVAKYWRVQDQAELLSILSGIFGITGSDFDTEWALHTTDISTATTTTADTNLIAETTIDEAIQKAVGDFGNQFTLAIMHSKVALRLAKLQMLNFRKYTDPQGIERQLPIADIGGRTVIVDDGVPVAANTHDTDEKNYTTYLFGIGAVRTADAPVKVPVEVERAAAKNGGQDTLYTRVRKTFHPAGFTFTKPGTGYTSSPTKAQLGTAANWGIVLNPKNIAIARVITNG